VDDIVSVANVVGGLAMLSRPTVLAAERGLLTINDVCTAIEEFSECVRYLNTRRSSGAVISLDSEADVQDVLYLILRPWVHDLVAETPTEKTGNRFAIRDFLSRSLRFVIEAKFVRDVAHGKLISSEIHDDIEVYRHNPYCECILFFIYDPDSLIPDQRELRRTIEQTRTYDGRPLTCRLIVKP
jgi:REase_DpnII-MboI